MCMMSVILDYGRKIDQNFWTTPILDEFKDILKKADDWDETSDQPHCEDPEKETWMKEVEDRLQKLESEQFRSDRRTLMIQ